MTCTLIPVQNGAADDLLFRYALGLSQRIERLLQRPAGQPFAQAVITALSY